MANKDDLIERAFSTLKQEELPTKQQKDKMLNCILMQGNTENASATSKLKSMVVTYPWRAAFTVSAVQAVFLTMIFGVKYTNLFLYFFGG